MSKEKREAKNKEWIDWRKAKKEGRLTEHRRELKRQKSKEDKTR